MIKFYNMSFLTTFISKLLHNILKISLFITKNLINGDIPKTKALLSCDV